MTERMVRRAEGKDKKKQKKGKRKEKKVRA